MWALAVVDLGLSESQFLALTLKQLDALCKRKRILDRTHERPLAQLAAMYYNAHRPAGTAAKGLEEFMLTKMSAHKKVVQTAAEMQHVARLITAAFNGDIK